MLSPEWSLSCAGFFDQDYSLLGDHVDLNPLHGRTVLLTGCTGFFGIWLIEYFDWMRREAGVDVKVVALTRDVDRLLSRQPGWSGRPWLVLVSGDVRNFNVSIAQIDFIIHGAADTSAEASRRPEELFDVIFGGTKRVLQLAEERGCKRVLVVSSGGVYGPHMQRSLISETQNTAPDTMSPSSAYGEGKRVSEALATYWSANTACEVVTARCFAFVGAGLPLVGHFAIGNFINDCLAGRNISLASTGKSVRSYLYAADLAVWLVALLLRGQAGRAYNVGSDAELTIYDTACLVRDVLSPKAEVRIADNASQSFSYYVPDISKSRTELSLDVWTNLTEAIRRTAEHATRIGPYRGSC